MLIKVRHSISLYIPIIEAIGGYRTFGMPKLACHSDSLSCCPLCSAGRPSSAPLNSSPPFLQSSVYLSICAFTFDAAVVVVAVAVALK